MGKKRGKFGSAFGSDAGKNPWVFSKVSGKEFLGKLDRKPTKMFRK